MRKSWVNIPDDCDFSIDNIPFGICTFPKASEVIDHPLQVIQSDAPRCCTAIGNYAVDLYLLAEAGLLDDLGKSEEIGDEIGKFHPRIGFSQTTLNMFMSTNKQVWIEVRNRLISLFIEDHDDTHDNDLVPDPRLKDNLPLRNLAMKPLVSVTCHLPATIGDYTDFYSCREHATNVGIMFRGKDNALQPNWLHMPIGYHGRSSSIFPSGSGGKIATVRRPCGQLQLDANDPLKGSKYGPCKLMDFELEVAFFVGGAPNNDSIARQMGRPMTLDEAKDRIFGFVLMNDWSARDIQKWEYVPLGPFTSKNYATTISPWVITSMALEPFRCETSVNKEGGGGSFDNLSVPRTDPVPLEYLADPNCGTYDVNLTVSINPSTTPGETTEICRSNLKHMYWSSAQQLVHHSVTGCRMNPGDLLASGTISGKEQYSFGSMLELSWKGSRDIELNGGETRKFLQDGDAVIMKGWCEKEGSQRVGFGECAARVLPADPFPYRQNSKTPQLVTCNDSRFAKFKLRGCFTSSFTKQVCIALSAKRIPYLYETSPHDKNKDVVTYPIHNIPTLEFMDGNEPVKIMHSLPIIEFLESCFTNQGARLLPIEPLALAKVKEVATILNSPAYPFADSDEYFVKSLMEKRLTLVEHLLSPYHSKYATTAGPFAIGSFGPTLADVCLMPQLQDARTLGIDLENICPTLLDIEKACSENSWFKEAM